MQSFAKNQMGILLVMALVGATAFTFGEEVEPVEPDGQVKDQYDAISEGGRPKPMTVGTNEWGEVVNQCQLGARLEKAEFQVGEPIRVHAVLRTLSGREFFYERFYGYRDDYSLSITTDTGVTVEPRPPPPNTRPSGTGGSGRSSVGPTHRSRHILDIGLKRYVLTEPGVYIITVTQQIHPVDSVDSRLDMSRSFQLVSNPVKLRILAKSEPSLPPVEDKTEPPAPPSQPDTEAGAILGSSAATNLPPVEPTSTGGVSVASQPPPATTTEQATSPPSSLFWLWLGGAVAAGFGIVILCVRALSK